MAEGFAKADSSNFLEIINLFERVSCFKITIFTKFLKGRMFMLVFKQSILNNSMRTLIVIKDVRRMESGKPNDT